MVSNLIAVIILNTVANIFGKLLHCFFNRYLVYAAVVETYSLLGINDMLLDINLLTFRRTFFHNLQGLGDTFLLVTCLSYSSTQKER